MRQAALVALLFACSLPVYSQTDDELKNFVEAVENDFQRLLLRAPEPRREHWLQEQAKFVDEFEAYASRLESDHRWLKQHPSLRDEHGTLAFGYLAQWNEYQLRGRTALTQGLGEELLQRAIADRLLPRVAAAHAELNALQERAGGLPLVDVARLYFELNSDIALLTAQVPAKTSIEYAPPTSAFDDAPRLLAVFTLHDWEGGLNMVEECESRLGALERELAVLEFTAPKDPLPYIPLAGQLAALLVVVARCLVAYTKAPSTLVLFGLVLISMVVSLALVFVSPSTTFNTLIQMVVPGGFLLFWLTKTRKIQPDKIVDGCGRNPHEAA